MSPIKEPHFFSTDLANRSVTSKCQYERLFRGRRPEHYLAGEASTWYLYSRDAVPLIERETNGARYIVMTRHPVEMFRSLHHHNLRVLHEDVADPEAAWMLQTKRANGELIPKRCTEPQFLQYQAVCSLGSQLDRLYGTVPRKRVLHISLESMRLEPRRCYLRVLDFLGVDDDGRVEFPAENPARGYRSATLQRLIRWGGRAMRAAGIARGLGLARINDKALSKTKLTEGFREMLESTFEEEQRKLKILGALNEQSTTTNRPRSWPISQ
jgi:hypothetical protein